MNVALNLTEEPKERTSCTADFTYKGYPVNVVSINHDFFANEVE